MLYRSLSKSVQTGTNCCCKLTTLYKKMLNSVQDVQKMCFKVYQIVPKDVLECIKWSVKVSRDVQDGTKRCLRVYETALPSVQSCTTWSENGPYSVQIDAKQHQSRTILSLHPCQK